VDYIGSAQYMSGKTIIAMSANNAPDPTFALTEYSGGLYIN